LALVAAARTSYVDSMSEERQMGPEVARTQPIFIQDFVDVESPYEVLRERFSGDSEWLAPIASAATQDGETLRMRIGPSWGAGLMTREVRISLGPARHGVDTLLRSLSWEATELPSLFPSLEGDVELAPIGPSSCRVSLAVVYTPPLGEFGARIDRALLHRVAQSTVRSFVTRVASNLRTDV